MGTDVNPGNLAFQRIAGSNYVDKTDLIRLMNARVDSSDCLVCVSRPRHFGKSYAVKMLTAYYDRSCNSHRLFDDKKKSPSQRTMRNSSISIMSSVWIFQVSYRKPKRL